MPKKSLKQPPARRSGVDLQEIERLLAFMEQHGLEEFEYERDSFRVRLKKPSAVLPFVEQLASPQAAPSVASGRAGAPGASLPGSGEPAAEAQRAEDLHVIKSPIVGTFYSAPTPEAASFVRLGDRVEAGQVLCIIEAMKLMNEIEADMSGELAKIFVENAQPVEYGEPLFAIRPQGKK
jgi:acetyl-CoA carboxylase biotin carboxyl carrier protein